MLTETLAAALEREHREIDGGIESFINQLTGGRLQAQPLVDALQALRRHIYLEEVFLFPPLRETGMVMPIFVMMREHGQLWRTMQALTELLDGGADRERLLMLCRDLLAQLELHNSKEEPVIYPRADIDLPNQTRTELAQFIDTGNTPEGWVCQQADPNQQTPAHLRAGIPRPR